MILFVTTNKNKYSEASKILECEQADMETVEIQADTLEEVARFSVQQAYEKLGKPCFVEDAGLFINHFNGFPGVYSKDVFYQIHLKGFLKLMEGVEDRTAVMKACVAYHDGKDVHVFNGEAKGTITTEVRGNDGFGYDPIFLPEGAEKTFAEDTEHKGKVSHRVLALQALKAYLYKGNGA